MKKKIATISLNFGGLSGDKSIWRKSRVVFIPVSYDRTSTSGAGSRRGPLAILEASTFMDLYDEQLEQDTSSLGLYTLPPLEPVSSSPEDMLQTVQQYVEPVLRAKKFPVLIGGEHTVTLGLAKALKNRYPQISFLKLDAHAGLRDSYKGSPFNHACVGRRMAEMGTLVQVGTRSISLEEDRYLRKSRIKTFFWHSLDINPGWENEVSLALSNTVYVTIDLDVFDPAAMPATSMPEPGGMNWESVTRLLRLIARKHTVVGFDVVELAPIPGLIAPDFLAAKLIYRFLGDIFYGNGRFGKNRPGSRNR